MVEFSIAVFHVYLWSSCFRCIPLSIWKWNVLTFVWLNFTYLHDFVGHIRCTLGMFCSSIVTRSVFCPHYHTLMRSQRYAARCVMGCDGPRFILVCPEGHPAGGSHFAAVALQLALAFPTGARRKLLEQGKVISHSGAVPAVPPASVVLSRDAQDGAPAHWGDIITAAAGHRRRLCAVTSFISAVSLSLSENDQKSKSVPQKPSPVHRWGGRAEKKRRGGKKKEENGKESC